VVSMQRDSLFERIENPSATARLAVPSSANVAPASGRLAAGTAALRPAGTFGSDWSSTRVLSHLRFSTKRT